jgi:carboxymethylenebutenolidase
MAELTFETGRGDLPVYLAGPTGSGPWPGVVVVHDAMGMGRDVRDQADWLAGAGFLAAAPDLFFWGRTLTCLRAAFRDIRRRSGPMFADVETVRAALAGYPLCTGKVGVIGDPIPLFVRLASPVLGYGFDAGAARDARSRIVDFFRTHLAG